MHMVHGVRTGGVRKRERKSKKERLPEPREDESEPLRSKHPVKAAQPRSDVMGSGVEHVLS